MARHCIMAGLSKSCIIILQEHVADNKSADRTARMFRLIFAVAVYMQQIQVFSRRYDRTCTFQLDVKPFLTQTPVGLGVHILTSINRINKTSDSFKGRQIFMLKHES